MQDIQAPQDAQDTVATTDDATSHATAPGLIALAAVASAALTACGGGGDAAPSAEGGRENAQALLPTANGNRAAAWRFLNRATLGPTSAEVDWVTSYGIEAWLTKQFGYSTPTRSYAADYLSHAKTTDWERFMNFAWWQSALGCVDQLRQRVVNALIEIMVVSLRDDTVGFRPLLAAGYMDVLAKHAFGNFRELIEAVAKAPAMGAYLSHFANQPPVPGRRIPDQNFARELIQLFTIGLTKLNMDGTPVLDGNGRPVSTTKATDIPLLSNVFTGWALDNDPALDRTVTVSTPEGPKTLADKVNYFGDFTETQKSQRYTLPMKGYSTFHSTQAQMEAQVGFAAGSATFLGESFTLGTNPQESLTKALDVIFRNPSIAPFIARQMIQRMVTSNPSPAYIQRVATAFKNANWGMQALIRAILTDTEANSATVAASAAFGKVREPLLRVTHLLRVYGVRSAFPANTDRVSDGKVALNLNQSPLRALSVFNFYSPSYVYVGGEMAKQGKVSPEMQIATEASVVAYINAVYEIIQNGLTQEWNDTYTGKPDFTEEINAATPSAVVGLINKKLFGGTMSAGLVSHLTTACTPVAGTTATAADRVRAAVFLAAASPEYLVQK